MSKAKKAANAEHRATRKTARLRDNPIVATLGNASEIADQPPLIAISLATLGAGIVMRRAQVIRAGVRMLASHLIATGVKSVIKSSVDRTRPARALDQGRHRVGKGEGSDDGGLNSFPSGHTAGAVAIAQAVARDAPAAALPIRLGAGAIGAMQLPRGKHYISDILVGAAIGWASERIASAVMDRGRRSLRDRADCGAEADVEAHPS